MNELVNMMNETCERKNKYRCSNTCVPSCSNTCGPSLAIALL